MTDLPSLRQSLEAHGLLAKKSFGQHFLLDLNVTRKIVRLAGPFQGRAVIEVGPGPGGLTRALLESDLSRLVLVEKDPRFLPLLSELDDGSGRLTLVEGDALNVREADLVEGPAHLVSNLPYNVGTPLLIKWLTGPWTPCALTLMFQKEVAERIVAAPGSGAYGRLAVLAQVRADVRIDMVLPARAFTPAPKVDSAVVQLVPKTPEVDVPIAVLEQVTAAAFGQRRKMLRQSLKGLPGALESLAALRIDSTRRAETLSVSEFVSVARALPSGRGGS